MYILKVFATAGWDSSQILKANIKCIKYADSSTRNPMIKLIFNWHHYQEWFVKCLFICEGEKQKNREMKWSTERLLFPVMWSALNQRGPELRVLLQNKLWHEQNLTLNTRRQISFLHKYLYVCCNLSLKLRVAIFVICLAGENHSIYLHSAESEWDCRLFPK